MSLQILVQLISCYQSKIGFNSLRHQTKSKGRDNYYLIRQLKETHYWGSKQYKFWQLIILFPLLHLPSSTIRSPVMAIGPFFTPAEATPNRLTGTARVTSWFRSVVVLISSGGETSWNVYVEWLQVCFISTLVLPMGFYQYRLPRWLKRAVKGRFAK